MKDELKNKNPELELNATIKFLKETKEGKFTEIPPITVTLARIIEKREPDYQEENYHYSYS